MSDEKYKKVEVTDAQKFARKYLQAKGKKMNAVLKSILVFEGLSDRKAAILAKELVEAAASLARGNAW